MSDNARNYTTSHPPHEKLIWNKKSKEMIYVDEFNEKRGEKFLRPS